VRGALSAVAAGLAAGIGDFMVPAENVDEARALGAGRIHGIGSLAEAARLYTRIAAGEDGLQTDPPAPSDQADSEGHPGPDYDGSLGDIADIRGHAVLKRALEILDEVIALIRAQRSRLSKRREVGCRLAWTCTTD
jgi:predicted ATPase with chaperone activity